ncbi:hypothetical protein NQ315_007521 [Exocentrus adspersus]|uniref:Tyrosine-protein kinase n=1 Tax=Exocentrus adspersus TaxID=1586481 RepID=A0AAV8W770_9CUCU|nr:hypothetical protein NQ315_007521 [Exocentrus adspersus]
MPNSLPDDSEDFIKTKRKEKGRIDLETVHTVEPAQSFNKYEIGNQGDLWPFLVGYQSDDDYSLFLLAFKDSDRIDWILDIRKVCATNGNVKFYFHPSPWTGKKWGCCKNSVRLSEGCRESGYWAQVQLNNSQSIDKDNNSNKENSFSIVRPKLVVALYNYKATESGDLSLEKNQEYEVIDDSQEHWWKVKDTKGNVGFIPSNYVKEKELLGLQQYEWYVSDMSRQRAESLLKQEDKEGCFVVRNSSTKGLYTLSLYTKIPHPHVKHYHIKQNSRGEFYLSEKHCCNSIADLINYHKHNSGGLASRLKTSPCDRPAPATAGLSHDKWEIDHNELMLLEELGSGQFGVVRRGKWRGSIDVAVKMMKEGTMSEDDFIEEAKVMTKLQHTNLVQLYGVCSKNRPIFIVTEYMRYGSLLNHLRRHEQSLSSNQGLLLDMCIQVGVLMWEVFTCGKMPYGRLKNTEVVDRVQKGMILEKPKACYKEVYDVMRKCWSHLPENRPSFRILKETLNNVSSAIMVD